MLIRVTVEMLLRTGLRVSEFTGLTADAVVLIGAGPSLHIPVGKLREDRYLPLHPQLAALIDDYRAAHVPPGHPLLLPRENGRALDRHTVTRMINRAGAAAGLPHIHPHQLRHTLADPHPGVRHSISWWPCPAAAPCEPDHRYTVQGRLRGDRRPGEPSGHARRARPGGRAGVTSQPVLRSRPM